MGKKIMIAGYGSAGAYLLDFLARTKKIEEHEIIVATRSKEEAIRRINTTLVSAGLMGFYPKIKYVYADLNNVEETAELLKDILPDVIAYTGRFIKGIKYGGYSYPNRIGYGVWIPLSITLIYKLMKAVKLSGKNIKVINSSFPDGVCPALASMDLKPFTGAGNLNHLIPRIVMGLSKKYNVKSGDIDVKMIGSHYLNTYVSKEASANGSPYFMECRIRGKKVQGISDEDIFKLAKINMMTGTTRNLMIASDIAKIIQSIIFDQGFFMHLPGPNGLIGGYPARIFQDRIDIELSSDVSIDEAININKESLAFDGIEKIESGNIYFTDESLIKMRELFSVQYPKKIHIDECEEFSFKIKEALERYR